MPLASKEGGAGPQTGAGDPDPKVTNPGDPGQSDPNTNPQTNAAGDGSDDSQFDIEKLDPRAKKLISDLRKENGDHRVKNKALTESHGKLKKALIDSGLIEDDDESPEDKLAAVSNGLQGATLKNAILESALEHGVGKENYRYFEFLVQDKLSSLEEDAELTDDDLLVLAQEARGRGGSGSGTTSVNDGKGGNPPDPKGSGEVNLDQFTNMSITDKTVLFKKNPDLYQRLFNEAKSKKLLIR